MDADEAPTAMNAGRSARSGKSGKSVGSRKKMMSAAVRKAIEDKHNAPHASSDDDAPAAGLLLQTRSLYSIGTKRIIAYDALPIEKQEEKK